MIKKIGTYLSVALISATFTLVGYRFISRIETDRTYDYNLEKPINSGVVLTKTNYDASGPPSVDFSKAASKTINAVVFVKNYSKRNRITYDNLFDYIFGFHGDIPQQPSEPEKTGAGSGVIISENGYIVTNNHVIAGADKIEVTLNNQKTFQASLVGHDPSSDLALLKIDAKNLPFVNFSDSDKAQVGQWVIAVGNPFNFTSTVTAGIISAKARSLNTVDPKYTSGGRLNPIESFIQTDAAVNSGNSGGALVDINGDLVGINTAIYSPSGLFSGYSFAIPSNLVRKIIQDIKRYGLVQRAYLGINHLDLSNEELVKRINRDYGYSFKIQEGILVTGVNSRGGSSASGMMEGDIIKVIDGKSIRNLADFNEVLGGKRPGDKVKVVVLRGEKNLELNVTLQNDRGNKNLVNINDLSPMERLGVSLRPLSKREKFINDIDYGLFIDKLYDGPLNNVKIREGFILLKINNQKLRNPKELNSLLRNYRGLVSLEYVDDQGYLCTAVIELK